MKNLKFLGQDGSILTAGNSGKTPPGQISTKEKGGGKESEQFQYFYHPDHLGSSSYITDASGEVYQHLEYFAFGETFVEEHSNTDRVPYLFNGKELDEETGLYYYGARYYDPVTSIFPSVDPLADERTWVSPYNFVQNNPTNRIDPTGALDNPIYGEEGTFLGTDDKGLQGDAIVMNKSDFKQGMSHEEATSKGTVLSTACSSNCISNDANNKIIEHFAELPSRPDYDGFVTIDEGINWAKAHAGALNSPSPDNTLYLDASQLDFGNLSTSDFATTGQPTPQNLLSPGNFARSAGNEKLRATIYALGRVDMTLKNRNLRSVSIVNNKATDYDWNPGGGFVRNTLINAERTRTGLNDSHGFKTFYYGTGTLKK